MPKSDWTSWCWRGFVFFGCSGFWGWKCKSSTRRIARSVAFPRLVYESDPLEEGEKDFIRGQEYKYCMHKVSLGESLDGVKGSFDY